MPLLKKAKDGLCFQNPSFILITILLGTHSATNAKHLTGNIG